MIEQAHQATLDRAVVLANLTGFFGRETVGPLATVEEAEVRFTLGIGVPTGFLGHEREPTSASFHMLGYLA